MNITTNKSGKYLIIKTSGRLDASWSDYFADICFEQIRNGFHDILIDAGQLVYISSAGIRSLVTINKELVKVDGTFLIINAQEFVSKTIEMIGFESWLVNNWPEEVVNIKSENVSDYKSIIEAQKDNVEIQKDNIEAQKDNKEEYKGNIELFTLNSDASCELYSIDNWVPWEEINRNSIKELSFAQHVFALGVGGVINNDEIEHKAFGEFISVAGHILLQPPDNKSRPDFLITEKDFIPQLEVIQSLYCRGEMSNLFRFAPNDSTQSFKLSEIAETALNVTDSNVAALVIMGESDGLVGGTIIRSPALYNYKNSMEFPEIRKWLSFSGERVHCGEQTIIFGIISRGSYNNKLLKPLLSAPGFYGHFHAAVFPYQPLKHGKIDIYEQTNKFLTGPPPKALLHLIDDDRPLTGVGESALIRGACWCSAITEGEGVL